MDCSNETKVTNQLEAAVKEGNETLVEVLLDCNGTNVNLVNQDGKTLLHMSSENGKLKVTKVLLKRADLDVNKGENTTGSTALEMAVTIGYMEMIELFISHHTIDINKGNYIGETALILASRLGNTEVLRLIIGHVNIDLNKATRNRKCALMVAAINGNTGVVKILLAQPGIEVNLATFDGKTALIYATLEHQVEIVMLLLRCPRIDTEILDEGYKTALQYARDKTYTNIVDAFQSRGPLILENGHTCCSDKIDRGLVTAVELDDITFVKTFMKCPQIDINTVNEEGYTSLYLAAKENKNDIVKVLLASPNIDINKHVVKNKESPLMVSAEEGIPDVVRLMLAHAQIDVNKLDSHGMSALQKAMKKGKLSHLRVIKLFLRCSMTMVTEQYDVQKDIAEAMKMHSLFLQMDPTCCKNVYVDSVVKAWDGDFRAIEGILRCPKSNINVIDDQGRTPLILASLQGHIEVVKVLLASPNIDINIGLPKGGMTAFSIASEKSHFLVMEQIIKKDEKRMMYDGWCFDNWTPHLILCKPTTGEKATLPTITVTGILICECQIVSLLTYNI